MVNKVNYIFILYSWDWFKKKILLNYFFLYGFCGVWKFFRFKKLKGNKSIFYKLIYFNNKNKF